MDGIVVRWLGAAWPVKVFAISSRVMVDGAAGVASVERTALTTTASRVSRDLRTLSRAASGTFCACAKAGAASANSAVVVVLRTKLKTFMAGSLRMVWDGGVLTIRSAPERKAQKCA